MSLFRYVTHLVVPLLLLLVGFAIGCGAIIYALGMGDSIWPAVGGAALASSLIGAVVWVYGHRNWVTPTRLLAEAARQMADGQWDRRIEPGGAEELRNFAGRFNLVAAHAQSQLAELRHQRADLQALVDTLPDPILVSDASGKLIHINEPAARLLDLPRQRAIGEGFVNVVNDEAILQLFDRVRAGAAEGAAIEPPLTGQIRLNRAGQWLTYQAVATRTPGRGVLLVLRDVSALAGAVQMKTDFVANASHELRTPISAIKIAFETLREVYGEDPQQAGRCMQIIDGHLRRLEEMLRDLLDLSKVERENLDLNVRHLKTAEVYSHLRSSLGPMARQKGVELRLGEEGPWPHEFLADEVLLNLVLKNLIENSIKFTPPGGFVRVDLRRSGDEAAPAAPPLDAHEPVRPVILSVIDTGIGIPKEHLDRVFERFYQVDPARSGSAGRGTGLGLAIVKHAIAALGGTVLIDSSVGAGTKVTCSLPQERQPIQSTGEGHESAAA